MNKTFAAFAAATVLAATIGTSAQAAMSVPQTAAAPAEQSGQFIHKTGKKFKFGAGLALGLGLGAALAHGHYYDGYTSRHERQCRRWRKRCWNGNDSACWKFDNRC